ncbi:serine/threonine protein kinase [Streptomyces sp. YC504]|uniref:non-specific serine/threonine protein kinase n=1 Tax=Streptomyces mesophilus TaxID=1775132 RepID=A0A6G4XE48_9ACTN|nr:serine/threonine-protein kinase [Streptomyces mesophilus]NGO75836.1 serine/threonine protein kinase [Streptomyces mesophilus]
MSNDGGAPYGPSEPTSFGLRPPEQPHAGGPYAGGPYGAPGTPPGPGAPNPYAHQSAPTQAHPGGPQVPDAPQPPSAPGAASVPTQVVHESDPGAGRLIAGRYRLLSKLGHGGMGTVWRAKDETVDREVAVKEPRVPDHLPERERATAFERMRREARAAARLDHPAVVNVHDVAVEDGQPWIVMEFVQGRSMGGALQEGTLGSREAARIGLEVLGALDAAHKAGILHRDVKPDNVMLGQYDRVVLTDFGIAQIEGETNLTDTGGFVGSPEFIAPERVLGQRPGPASDLWSLGVVLYAATEGVSPFRRSNTPATLQSVLNATPAAPASAAGPLADVINGLLQKDPGHRPDAVTVRRLLEEAVKPPAPPVATQVMTSGQASGPTGGVRVGKKVLIGAGAAFVALAVALGLVIVDPFAGGAAEGFTSKKEEGLKATLSVPANYDDGRPEKDDGIGPPEHWVSYTDPSGSVWVGLTLYKGKEDDSGNIADSADAEMYEDNADFKESGSSNYNMASDPAPTTQPETKLDFEGGKAAKNTVTYMTTDTTPRPREMQVFYYKAKNGDMYKLAVDYPGKKSDFYERGREVAEQAIKGLDITNP